MTVISESKVQHYFAIGDSADTTTGNGRNIKGEALTDVICYIFEKMHGIEVTARNVTNVFTSEEIDVVLWNEKTEKGFYFLPNIIFVECKNWNNQIGSSEVREFESKLRGKGLSFGIMVAANGISGSQIEKTSAHHVIDRALADGRQIIVITRNEIESLTDTNHLVRLVKEKICKLYATVNVL